LYINETVQTIQNTVNTSTLIIKTPTHYKTSINYHSTRYTPNEIVTIHSSALNIRSP
jgi:type III secretory pathway component EscU